jgi:nucleotide-binding universal stress UspA family protein
MQPTRILFATDFGEAARRARAHVELLARLYGATVLLVHVQHSAWKSWVSSGLVERQAGDRLAAWAKELEQTGGTSVEGFEVVQGSPAEAVLHVAERRQADLIVIGSGDKSLVERVRTGATAETVARFARQPVWISRPLATGSIRSVLCGIDCSEGSGHALVDAAELAVRAGAQLTLVSALGNPELNPLGLPEEEVAAQTAAFKARHARELDAFVSRFDFGALEPDGRWVWGAPAEVIRDMARDEDFDLVVLGRTGLSGLRRVLLGATSERVLRQLNCSLLLTGPV